MLRAIHLRYVLFTLLSSCVQQVVAQSFAYYNYSVSEGLPSSEVYDIHQDKQGFLWFATDNGVARYDGVEFKKYHVKDSVADPVIFGFYEDNKGRLWFRSYSAKLAYYQHGKISKFRYNHVIVEHLRTFSIINSLYVGDNDEVWFGGRNFLGKITQAGLLKETPEAKSQFVVKRRENMYLVATYNQYHDKIASVTVDENTFTLGDSAANIIEHSNNAYTKAILIEGKTYLSYNKLLFRYENGSLKIVRRCSNLIISLSSDSRGNLWVGYLNGGVERFNTQNFERPYKPLFLETKSVTRVLEDHESGLWFATLEGGAYFIPDISVINIDFDGREKIKAIEPWGDKYLLAGQTGNIYRFDPKTTRKTLVISIPLNLFTAFRDSHNNFWIGTNANTQMFTNDFSVKKTEVIGATISFCEDPQGVVWSMGGQHLRQFDHKGTVIKDDHLHKVYRSIYVDDSLMYLPERTGLYAEKKSIFISNDFQTYTDAIVTPIKFKDIKISGVMSLTDRVVLLATQGSGFLLMDKTTGVYKQYDTQNNFAADNIYAYMKSDSSLWLATEKGLIQINTPKLLKDSLVFKNLSLKGALIAQKIDFLEQTDREILAFADNGVSIIPKRIFSSHKNKPLFYLNTVFVNQVPADSGKLSSLNYDQNNIKISYGFVSFGSNQDIISRFRLSEADAWSYSSARQLEFHSLAPGTYNLQVEFSHDHAHWIKAISKLSWTINSPWWKRWYYQVIPAIMLIGFLVIYFSNRYALVRQQKQNFEILNQNQQKLLQAEIQTTEKERSRIAKDLHDSVGTTMAALKMHVGHLLRKHGDADAETIENQLQAVIQEIKEIIYNLSPPGVERYGLFSIMKNLGDKLNRSSEADIVVNTYGEDLHNNALNIAVLRITQELLSNSLKYSGANRIILHLSVFEERLNLIFEDNGVGFSLADVKRGSGIHNIETRIESLKGQMKFESGSFGVSYNIDIPLINVK